MYLNSASSKSISSCYLTPNPSQTIPYYEKQHLNYLDKIATNESVSLPISRNTDDFNEFKKSYSEEYLGKETALDIDEQIQLFNKTLSFNNMNFVDWFALQNYKHAGYVKINQALRDNILSLSDYPAEIKQLYLTLMHQTLLQSMESKYEGIIYRGEIRDINFANLLNKGDTLKTKAFWSTSTNQETARYFCCDANELNPNQYNVSYLIENNNPYSGTNISKILRDGEEEFLFLPNTEFKIVDTHHDGKNKTINVRLETYPTTEYALIEKIHQIIFP
ncbi:TPA: ADP-ribosyltransferase domain-containing protein [Providencia alcalifaciens]